MRERVLLATIHWLIRHGLCNCRIYAWAMWRMYGGYIIYRWSRNNRWPWLRWKHAIWAPALKNLQVYQYVPHDDEKPMPLIFFRGRIKVGLDGDET